MISIAFHLFCYYLAWFTAVLSAAHGKIWLGLLVTLAIVLCQWIWQWQRGAAHRLWSYVLIVVLLGFISDSFLLHLNLIVFKSSLWAGLQPPWMLAMWISFAVMFFSLLRGYFERYLLLSLCALLGFPLAYFAGVKLGAATLPRGIAGTVMIGVIWMVFLPLTTFIYNKFWLRK